MKILIKESSNSQENIRELKEINGKFELSKPQISRGNVLNIRFDNKDFSIKL